MMYDIEYVLEHGPEHFVENPQLSESTQIIIDTVKADILDDLLGLHPNDSIQSIITQDIIPNMEESSLLEKYILVRFVEELISLNKNESTSHDPELIPVIKETFESIENEVLTKGQRHHLRSNMTVPDFNVIGMRGVDAYRINTCLAGRIDFKITIFTRMDSVDTNVFFQYPEIFGTDIKSEEYLQNSIQSESFDYSGNINNVEELYNFLSEQVFILKNKSLKGETKTVIEEGRVYTQGGALDLDHDYEADIDYQKIRNYALIKIFASSLDIDTKHRLCDIVENRKGMNDVVIRVYDNEMFYEYDNFFIDLGNAKDGILDEVKQLVDVLEEYQLYEGRIFDFSYS